MGLNNAAAVSTHSLHSAKPTRKPSLAEVSQAGSGVYKSSEGAGDLSEDKSHRVIDPLLCHLPGELGTVGSAAWSLLNKDLEPVLVPRYSSLFQLAQLCNSGPHHAQMVAIVLPRPLPHSAGSFVVFAKGTGSPGKPSKQYKTPTFFPLKKKQNNYFTINSTQIHNKSVFILCRLMWISFQCSAVWFNITQMHISVLRQKKCAPVTMSVRRLFFNFPERSLTS